MSTTELACNHCGAPLDVPDSARFATCAHCGSRLTVHRNETAAWTEVAERIAADTGRISEGMTLLTLQAELERLDREWAMQQPEPGGRRKDDKPDTALGALIGLAIPLFAIYMIFGQDNPQSIWLVLIILAIAMVVALRSGAFARLFGPRLTEAEYQRRRAELVRRIEGLGGSL